MATKRKAAQNELLTQLRERSIDPEAQAAFAATLLDARHGAEVIVTVLQILTNTPVVAARPALWKLYEYYSGRGQQRDPAAYLRAAIVRALRAVVTPTDLPQIAAVADTYVFPPPEFREEGAMLRSAALATLNELDDELARFHAVRLLANEHTNPMSGEPALTAANVLAAQGEILPLYFYVMQDLALAVPEVVSVCLGNLTALRVDLLPALLERFVGKQEQAASEIILVGLFDLLLNHEAGPQGLEYLTGFLRTSHQLDAYRYLVVTMATSGNPELTELLLTQADATTDPAKALLLVDALCLLRSSDERVVDQIAALEGIAR